MTFEFLMDMKDVWLKSQLGESDLDGKKVEVWRPHYRVLCRFHVKQNDVGLLSIVAFADEPVTTFQWVQSRHHLSQEEASRIEKHLNPSTADFRLIL